MGGRPCLRGLRVTVGTIVGLLAAGRTREEILQAYPYLEPEDIHRGSRTAPLMKLLLDMNLSPAWVGFLAAQGFETAHWSTCGEPTATDLVIMGWARAHGFVVITHDLDFSALLASTEEVGPSVVLVRSQDVLPGAIGADLVRVPTSAS
jgi:predicted nuclease of predicted toxin-antitoxin system